MISVFSKILFSEEYYILNLILEEQTFQSSVLILQLLICTLSTEDNERSFLKSFNKLPYARVCLVC